MKKNKLINVRKQKNVSQEEMSELLHMDTSSYNRREKGKAKICNDEWEKIARFLKVPLGEIYEPEEGFIIIKSK